MAVIGPALAAGVSLLDAVLKKQSSDERQDLAEGELLFRQSLADELRNFGREGSVDALGNRIEYVPGVGFVTRPTETTSQILAAGQREELANLTEDAPRNRRIRERAEGRGKEADKLAREAIAQLRFSPDPNARALGADFTRLALLGRRRGIDQASDTLARQALRLGRGGDVGDILQSAERNFADTAEEALVQGRLRGRQEARTERQSRTSDLLNRLAGATNVANQGTTSVRLPTIGRELTGRTDAATNRLLNALSRQSSTVGPGFSAVRSSEQPLDLSSFASFLSRIQRDKPPGIAASPIEEDDFLK